MNGGEYASVNGVRLFYRRVGSAMPPVLVPDGVALADVFERLSAKRTVILYDLRNRGRSEPVVDRTKLEGGIHNDVDDLEALRQHFGFERVDLIGHSYKGLIVALHAAKYPRHVRRVVQIGPIQPDISKQYPPELSNQDAVAASIFTRLAQLGPELAGMDPQEACRRFWETLSPLYVLDPRDASKLIWRCDLPNELGFTSYWNEYVMPSMQKLSLQPKDFAHVTAAFLIVHGRKDRSAPYGGALDWAKLLPDTRVLTVENAAHAPWIEAPETVFGALETFLDGVWPAGAASVEPVT